MVQAKTEDANRGVFAWGRRAKPSQDLRSACAEGRRQGRTRDRKAKLKQSKGNRDGEREHNSGRSEAEEAEANQTLPMDPLD
jgi:hypothetical protein